MFGAKKKSNQLSCGSDSSRNLLGFLHFPTTKANWTTLSTTLYFSLLFKKKHKLAMRKRKKSIIKSFTT